MADNSELDDGQRTKRPRVADINADSEEDEFAKFEAELAAEDVKRKKRDDARDAAVVESAPVLNNETGQHDQKLSEPESELGEDIETAEDRKIEQETERSREIEKQSALYNKLEKLKQLAATTQTAKKAEIEKRNEMNEEEESDESDDNDYEDDLMWKR